MGSEIKCAYCGGNANVRPVTYEALCWPCWYERFGEFDALRRWKAKRWWRRFCP